MYDLSLVDSSTSFLSYSTDDSVFERCHAIYETGLVKYCYPNFAGGGVLDATIPNDPYFGKQYYLYNTGQTINDGKSGTSGADIKVTDAWDITKGNSNVKIAIIDDGVEGNHPDLPSSQQLRLNGSNTCVSQWANNNPNDPEPYGGEEAHGTAIAGIINAAHNTEGIAGICPDCKIMPIRYVIGYPASYHVKAFDFAVLNGADIISSSISYTGNYTAINVAYENAVKAGVLICQSVGNTANRINNDNGYPLYPSANFIEKVISVASSNRYDQQSNYSPTTDAVTLSATSNHSFYNRIQNDSWDIWTTDRINQLGYNSWPGPPWINTTFPTQYEILPNSGTNHLRYTGRFGGTSAAAPQVAGVAGLMKSVNQCLGLSQIHDLLIHTTDMVGGYSYFPSETYEAFNGKILKANHSPQLGHGRINAYKAVKAAQDVYKSALDLYVKDNEFDFGDKQSWGGDKSPDIWVRQNPDGFTKKVHQSPFLNSNRTIYIYVRVRNKSCTDFINTSNLQRVQLYYTQSATWTSWPSQWTQIPNTAQIPDIPAGEEAIVEIPWTIPTNLNIAHNSNICLIAKINLPFANEVDGVQNYPERLDHYITKQNNIASRNFSLISMDVTSDHDFSEFINLNDAIGTGRYVLVGNPYEDEESYDLSFNVPYYNDPGVTDITEEAEVKLVFDSLGYAILNQAGVFEQAGVTVLAEREVVLSSPNIRFENILFPANTQVPIYMSFGFWSDQQTSNEIYEYRVQQYFHSIPDTPIGNQNFGLVKTTRTSFSANAGSDEEINLGNSITLNASSIGEDAYYHWYDEDFNLIGTNASINVSPTSTTAYTLEVIASEDGFKDYDEINVVVHQYFITSITPNPASAQITVNYAASLATTASIMITPASGGTSTSYTISPSESSIIIDISSYSNGNYIVNLVCNGHVEDSENLLIVN